MNDLLFIMFKNPIYINESIFIREFQISDASTLFTVINKNRNYLKTFLSWVEYNLSLEDSEKFIIKNEIEIAKTSIHLGIWSTTTLVGAISLNKIDWNIKKADIGYWLDEELFNKEQ